MIQAKISLILLFLSTAAIWTVQPLPAQATAIDDGIKAYGEKKYQIAIAKFQMAVKADQKNSQALYYLAAAHQASGNMEKAIPNYKDLVLKFPNSSEAKLAEQQLGPRFYLSRISMRAQEIKSKLEKEEHKKNINVVALVSRSYAQDRWYPNANVINRECDFVADYSFQDNARNGQKRNEREWVRCNIQFGNGHDQQPDLGVNMCGGDASSILDLGQVKFGDLKVPVQMPGAGEDTHAIKGHLYIIRVKNDEYKGWTKMQVLDMKANDWIIIRYENFH